MPAKETMRALGTVFIVGAGPGNPDLNAFPRDLWARLTAKYWHNAHSTLLGYGDPRGYRPFRAAIADYVRRVRGVRCDERQVW